MAIRPFHSFYNQLILYKQLIYSINVLIIRLSRNTLLAFDFVIEYYKEKLNLANTPLKRLDIIKLREKEKDGNIFLSTL